MKLIGAGCILVSSILFGICFVNDLRQRVRFWSEWKKALLWMRGEINFAAPHLAALFLEVQEKCSPPISDFFKSMGHALEQKESGDVGELWSKTADDCFAGTALNKEDHRWVSSLGQLFGLAERVMQLGMLDLYIEQVEEKLTEAQKQVQERTKLYFSTCTMGGLLLVLILL